MYTGVNIISCNYIFLLFFAILLPILDAMMAHVSVLIYGVMFSFKGTEIGKLFWLRESHKHAPTGKVGFQAL